MVYTTAEKVEIIALFFQNGDCENRPANRLNELHPESNVTRRYVSLLVEKFRQTGSVRNIKKQLQRERLAHNELVEIGVLGQVVADPTLSTRELATITNIPRTSIQKFLKKNKFHPYKIRLVHELNQDDFDCHLEFCELM